MTGPLALGLTANTEASPTTACCDPVWLPVALEQGGSWSFCLGGLESEFRYDLDMLPSRTPIRLVQGLQHVAEQTAVNQTVTLGCFRKGIQAGLPLASPTRSLWP